MLVDLDLPGGVMFGLVDFSWKAPKTPPSAPPAIPPIIITPFSYHTPGPAIDPLPTPPGPPITPPPCPRQHL
jgi:hypothetical protein